MTELYLPVVGLGAELGLPGRGRRLGVRAVHRARDGLPDPGALDGAGRLVRPDLPGAVGERFDRDLRVENLPGGIPAVARPGRLAAEAGVLPEVRRMGGRDSGQYHPWGWEIFNEPDCPRRYAYDQRYFGSWVDDDDQFTSRASCIGEFCAEVYPLIRATGAVVIGGALLGAPSSLEFAQGWADGGGLCDCFSFHKYLNLEKGDEFDDGFVYAEQLRTIVQRPLVWNETNILGDGSASTGRSRPTTCSI